MARIWEDGSLFYDVSPSLSQAEPERLRQEDVVRIYRPRPDDLHEPYGVAAMVWKEILAEESWSEAVQNWFSADARPQLALEHPDTDGPAWLANQVPWDDVLQMWQQAQNRRRGSMVGVRVPLPAGFGSKSLPD